MSGFTGGDTLTGLARQVSDVIVKNELGPHNAYALSHAGTKTSGYSFGAVQWDLAARPEVRDGFFSDILNNATFPNGSKIVGDTTRTDILKKVLIQGDRNALTQEQKALVNLALSSEFGVQTINAEHVLEVNSLLDRVNDFVVSVANIDNQALFESSTALLFLADFQNQFSTKTINALKSFIQTGEGVPPGGSLVEREGSKFGLDDLLRFYFSTGYAQTAKGLNDELRRFGNVLQVAGGYIPQNTEEAKGILSVFEEVREQQGQLSYYSKVAPSLIQPAKGFLIVEEALGHSIDGDVVVGSGGDPIEGTERNDLVLGGDGHDVLIGGKGDDVLRGGAGKDLYVYNSGDGHDVIVDNPTDGLASGDGGDGKGAIVYDSHLLEGGIKKTGESEYKSLDGTFTFVWNGPGSDLVVNNTLTIKDFSNGDLGITLANAPEIVTDFGPATRTEFQKVDHFVQVGTDLNGNPIFEPVFANFFDDASNDTRTTSDPGRLTPPIGDNNKLIHAGGGSDFIASGAGNDSLLSEDNNNSLLMIGSTK
ncbi:MAG: hypothetical protein DMG05_25550 [Acidobacteria bacterium]|nr:MAG: hypothetical protein DMG05_25550 [Acidobacteriota bacterium]